ncbi:MULTISPECIES: ATP-dependent DNA helicase [unclassified Paracoccus (in: a-proteobacteria)]|uniref:ATP-dependent DNA helicase n=1 Tax=unclassified Paracoccus (in: a-proteobacteria) TaxID=2688777 RepID=UPI0012B33E3C|nr:MULTISPECIES: AAA family ATPase [unclassified Paracoccus (in: a-proteobacteria)]UXU74739.1 AAA family ATPase [Paracoccus sp. SMMA_5]UXU80635.1 AAA family ATPase [Paracoccus sp. SMMA_5_TC]
MTQPALSPDQAEAWDAIALALEQAGVDLISEELSPPVEGQSRVLAVIGKAGSGKTLLLAQLTRALRGIGVDLVSGDYEGKRRKDRRSVAILAPTNKAAFVLRTRGVPATTIHRILYTPVYDPDYERIADWLTGAGDRPKVEGVIEGLTETALDRAKAFYDQHASIPGALAAAGLRGSDFIRGWKRREDGLDIGLIDEASMLDERQLQDLREIFPVLILFGDPAQLAPVGQSGQMVFDRLPAPQRLMLNRIHRQQDDSPILDLAHALADPDLEFDGFERMIRDAAARDPRVVWAERVESDLMAQSPVLVWRNITRVKLIQAFRAAYGAPGDALLPGEPLICDGLELPLKHRKKRIDLEARGLIKGAQVVYLGPGRKPGFSRLHVVGAEDPRLSAASIVKIETPDVEEPFIPYAARMGATFLHGAAVTIHKAQGSQWPDVQVFAPDIAAAAWSGRSEAGVALWKRLAYVAITRAQQRLLWVVRSRLARPTAPLGVEHLDAPAAPLELVAASPDQPMD